MIKIPQRYRDDVLRWLHDNVASNQPRLPQDRMISPDDIAVIPHHVSTTAQIAYWCGFERRWHVHQASRYGGMLTVECQDPEIETYIATRWS